MPLTTEYGTMNIGGSSDSPFSMQGVTTMKKWLDDVKTKAQRMSDTELMYAMDILGTKVAKNPSEAMAIKLMDEIYFYELQLRMWEE